MSVLDRKLRRELFAAKGLLAAVIGIIVVGISSFVSMASLYFNLEQSRLDYYAQCRMADFSVSLKKIPLTELDRLSEIRQITEFRPRISFPVTVDLEDVYKPLSGMVLSLPEEPAPIIDNIVLRRGGYFTSRRRGEVIVNEKFAEQRHIKPGDYIHLVLNNRREELYVVGTAISSEFVYLLAPGGLIPDPDNYGVFYVKQRFAEEVFDFEGACNNIVGLLSAESRDRPEAVLQEIETRLEPFGVSTTTPLSRQPSHWFLYNEIQGLKITTTVLPAVFLAVAALILNVLMMRMAEQQRTVVGTLKSLGYRNREIFFHFLKIGITVGVIGGVLGCILGYVFAGMITDVYRQYFEFPRLENRPHVGAILLGAAISIIFAVGGTLRGVRSVVRLAPAEAMRPKPPQRGGRIVLEQYQEFWRRLDFRWQMVLRSVFRSRTRTFAGLFAAMIGAALMLVTFYFRDSMDELVSFQFDSLLKSDFDLTLGNESDFGVLYETRHIPGVDYVEPMFVVGCKFHNGHISKQGAVTGLITGAQLTVPRDTSGKRMRIPPQGLLLTRKLAEVLAVHPGDQLTIVPTTGRREPRRVNVAAVADSYLGMAAYADFHFLNRLVGETDSVSMMQLKVDANPEATRLFYRELKRTPNIEGVSAIREQRTKLVETLVGQMLVSIAVTIGFAGMIFFGSVLNSSLISLSERQQEIATLRVLGYTPREIGVIFLRESLCVNFTGTLLGLPLGYLLCLLFVWIYNFELFRLPFVISTASWFVTVFLGIGFTLAAHVPVQRAINRLDWLQALNVKE